MRALGLAFLPFFPLASGLLTGKFEPGKPAPADSRLSLSWTSRFTTDKNVRIAEALKAFAAARHHTLLELAFSWLASWPQVASVIAGATSPEQVRANAAAVNWSLSREELAEIRSVDALKQTTALRPSSVAGRSTGPALRIYLPAAFQSSAFVCFSADVWTLM